MQIALKTSPRELPVSNDKDYYVYPVIDPSEVSLTAEIPPDNHVPVIEGNDGKPYPGGIKLEFDTEPSQESVTVTLRLLDAAGWSIQGWNEVHASADSTTWRRKIPSSVINDMLLHADNSWTLCFKFVHTSGKSHDPGIVITRPT